MAITDEIKEQTVKLKEMSNKQKLQYIWHYYKLWIIGIVFGIIAIISVSKSIIRNSRPVYLDAMFINSGVGSNAAAVTLSDDFAKSCGIDMNDYNMNFDYTTYLGDDYGADAAMAGQVKLIAKYQAGECDIVCGPESMMMGQADVGGYTNFEEALPEGMLDELIKKGYEPFYYTEKIYDTDATPDANGDLPYTYGESYMGGIYIDNCPKLKAQGDSGIYPESDKDRYVLTIAVNTEHFDHAIEFINFITE